MILKGAAYFLDAASAQERPAIPIPVVRSRSQKSEKLFSEGGPFLRQCGPPAGDWASPSGPSYQSEMRGYRWRTSSIVRIGPDTSPIGGSYPLPSSRENFALSGAEMSSPRVSGGFRDNNEVPRPPCVPLHLSGSLYSPMDPWATVAGDHLGPRSFRLMDDHMTIYSYYAWIK